MAAETPAEHWRGCRCRQCQTQKAMSVQQYVSNELTHFVGRALGSEEKQFDLLFGRTTSTTESRRFDQTAGRDDSRYRMVRRTESSSSSHPLLLRHSGSGSLHPHEVQSLWSRVCEALFCILVQKRS